MSEIRFYHLQSQSLEQALPALLTKAHQGGKNIIVNTSPDMVEKLNESLWTFNPNSFLPHGSAKDGNAELQPIWITDKDENPNSAAILILTNNATSEISNDFDLTCEMFDGRVDQHVQDARARWKTYKENEALELSYWQQTQQGGWEQKA